KASSLENNPHKSNSIRYFLIIIVNSTVRLADLNYGLCVICFGFWNCRMLYLMWRGKINTMELK
ncbi:unnamed protein product, partial [Brassica oleracea]